MKQSKYATLDAVIVNAIRTRPVYGASHTLIVNYGSVRAFAAGYGANISRTVSRRLRALSAHDRVRNNGVSGDGCQWFAAP